MRYIVDKDTCRYTHALYWSCPTKGCVYSGARDLDRRWKFCPECGAAIREIRVPLADQKEAA